MAERSIAAIDVGGTFTDAVLDPFDGFGHLVAGEASENVGAIVDAGVSRRKA